MRFLFSKEKGEKAMSQKKIHKSVRAMTEGAILIAAAEVLSFLPLYKLPWGGSIDFAMLPIILFCVRWGFGPGMLVSSAHAILQAMFEGGIAIGWQSLVGDFLVAYAVLGVAGLFKGKFCLAATASCAARFLVHYVVGATIWAEYMPETFFGMTMTTPWFYSALYNGAYMLPDMVLVLAAGILLMKTPAKKLLLGQDLR
jgi:thiamine transporter